jgi:chromosome segregation ATPase
MDSIVRTVGEVEDKLLHSGARMTEIKEEAGETIEPKIHKIQQAITNGETEREHMVSELRSCLLQLEWTIQSESEINLGPQIKWLSASLPSVVKHYKTGSAHAKAAMTEAMTYAYEVNDLRIDIQVTGQKLKTAQEEAQLVAARNKRNLKSCESRLKTTRNTISSKTSQISQKRSEISDKNNTKSRLETELINKRNEAAQYARKKDKRAGKAALGFVCSSKSTWNITPSYHLLTLSANYRQLGTVASIALVPVTGGLSLAALPSAAAIGT